MISGALALAGKVWTATGGGEPDVDRMLPVAEELAGLLPGRGLRRGSTVSVAPGEGHLSASVLSGQRSAFLRESSAGRCSAVQAARAESEGSVGLGPVGDRSPVGPDAVRARSSAGPGAGGDRSPAGVDVVGEWSSAGVDAGGGRVSAGRKAPAGWDVLGGGKSGGVGGLRRGERAGRGRVAELMAGGGTSLMLGLIAAASRNGAWCAVVGVPAMGMLAAAESGVVLERLALVPEPGPDWAAVVAALIDGVDLVVVAVPGPVPAGIVSRLAARARQRGSVLVPFGDWAGADVSLSVESGRWEGLGSGRGRLRRREVTVLARGRGAAVRPREVTMWMPGVTIRPDVIPSAPAEPEDAAVRRWGGGGRGSYSAGLVS